LVRYEYELLNGKKVFGKMNRRVLIIGIDGGTWRVPRPAMEQGYTPRLKEVVDTGASGILKSTIPAITPKPGLAFRPV